MATNNNAGQFGNRKDTQQRAHEGGMASSGSFKKGDKRASTAGKRGAEALTDEQRAKGGRNSHKNNG